MAVAFPWITGAPAGGMSEIPAFTPGGTLICSIVAMETDPPCLSISGFATLERVRVAPATAAVRRNVIALKARNPPRKTERKSTGMESRNQAHRSIASDAPKIP